MSNFWKIFKNGEVYWNLSKGLDKEIFLWHSDNSVTLAPFAVQENLGMLTA